MPVLKHAAPALFLLIALMLVAPLPSTAAQAFRWLDAEGQLHSLEEYRGKPVIVHVWASWCPPCRAEMPEMTAWLHAHPDVPFLPVSVDESAQDARDFMQHINSPLPLLLSESREAAALGIRVLPSTLVFDGNGEVKRRMFGSQMWQEKSFSDSLLKDIEP